MNRKLTTTFIAALVAVLALPILTAPAVAGPPAQSSANSKTQPESPQVALGSAFTYQGRLTENNNPANGQYDLRFTLFDALSGGSQVGSPLSLANQAVANGLFTVSLDFGSLPFTGDARYLQLEVKPAGGPSYTLLSPRQPLTPSPYALSLRPGAIINGATSNPILSLTNTSSNGTGISGVANSGTTAKAVQGESANGYGGFFTSSTGIGVSASGYDGVSGTGTAADGNGVRGTANNGSNARGVTGISSSGTGVYGTSAANNGTGTYGVANTGTTASGVRGESAAGRGVYGTSTSGAGVYGNSSTGYGGNFTSTSNNGINASGVVGVNGTSTSAVGTGVVGTANNGGAAVGVYGSSTAGSGVQGDSISGRGVDGTSTSGSGGYFTSVSGNGITVMGGTGINSTGGNGVYSTGTASNGVGVWGVANSGSTAKGVYGTSTSGFGVYGSSAAVNGAGVYGRATANEGRGLYGFASGEPAAYALLAESSTGWAGYFIGDVSVTGSCCGAGEVYTRIDHPLDPENKYLDQALVQSPDLLSVINGNVTTSANSEATVQLPAYFQAANSDFRYTLTVIGQFAQAIISKKLEAATFTIKTDKPNVEVSWQVTGVRSDPYALANPIQAEIAKSAEEQGKYAYPDLYSQPRTKGVNYELENKDESQP